jgi:hypothetical protein
MGAVAAAAILSGCFLAAAGAGAGGAIYLTSQGAESLVPASVDRTFSATEGAFGFFELQRTELKVEGDGGKRQIKGKPTSGDPEVTVSLEERSTGSTNVEVTARTGPVTWDKDYARKVVEKIVELAKQ